MAVHHHHIGSSSSSSRSPHHVQPLAFSREIAELTGKRHDHVMRDIRDMLEDLGECPPKFGGTSTVRQPNGGERQIPCFNLPKRETLILIAGYSIPIRARIIDRWMELEAEALCIVSNADTPAI